MSVLERLSTSYLTVRKPLLELYEDASSTETTGDIGFFSSYYDSVAATNKFTGLFRDQSDSNKYKLFTGLTERPSSNSSVSTDAKNGFAYADLNIGAFKVNDETQATTSADGCATFAGGVGIAKALYVGGLADVATTLNVHSTNTSTSSSTGSATFGGGVGIAENAYIGGLVDVGTTLNVQSTQSSTDSKSGSGKFAGGVGIAENAYIGGLVDVGTTLNVKSTTGSTSNSTGSAKFAGGVGIAENAYIGGLVDVGTTLNVKSTQSSTSSSTGSAKFAGGVGIAENAYIGGLANVAGALYADGALSQLKDNILMSNIDSANAAYRDDAGYASARKPSNIKNDTAKISDAKLADAYTALATSMKISSTGTSANYYKGWYIKDAASEMKLILSSSYDAKVGHTLTLASGFTNAGAINDIYSLYNRSNVGWVWDESAKYISAYAFPRDDMNILDPGANDGSAPEYANIIVGDLKVMGSFVSQSTAMVIDANKVLSVEEVLNNNVIYVDTSANANTVITVTLPALSGFTRKSGDNDYSFRVSVINVNAGKVLLTANAADKIEDFQSFSLNHKWDKQTLISGPDGVSDWVIE